jgi:hypothetical protein
VAANLFASFFVNSSGTAWKTGARYVGAAKFFGSGPRFGLGFAAQALAVKVMMETMVNNGFIALSPLCKLQLLKTNSTNSD